MTYQGDAVRFDDQGREILVYYVMAIPIPYRNADHARVLRCPRCGCDGWYPRDEHIYSPLAVYARCDVCRFAAQIREPR